MRNKIGKSFQESDHLIQEVSVEDRALFLVFLNPRLLHHLHDSQSLLRIFLNHSPHEGFEFFAHVGRKFKSTVDYLVHRVLLLFFIKGGLPRAQLIRQNSYSPNVHCMIIISSCGNFRRHVVHGAAK